MGFRRSLVRIQSPRHLRLVVAKAYGKPLSLDLSVPGRLWAGIDAEADKKSRPKHDIKLNARPLLLLNMFPQDPINEILRRCCHSVNKR
jgi:hypothetical protein